MAAKETSASMKAWRHRKEEKSKKRRRSVAKCEAAKCEEIGGEALSGWHENQQQWRKWRKWRQYLPASAAASVIINGESWRLQWRYGGLNHGVWQWHGGSKKTIKMA